MTLEKWVAFLGIAGTIAGTGATIVARFSTLENAKERQLEEIVELKQRATVIEARVLAMEVEKETTRNFGDMRKDIEVLKVRVDGLYGSTRRH